MIVLDARTHVGRSRNTVSKIPSEQIISEMDRNQIDAAIVQPLPSAADFKDYVAEHDAVLELGAQFPGRIFGLACIPPQIGREMYMKEAKRLVVDQGFVGLKYHPLFHGGSLDSTNAYYCYDAARELGTSVSVHTGPGIPWTSPSLMIPVAKKYPEVTFILVHGGGWLGAEEAAVTAGECPNCLIDTSWHYPVTVSMFIRKVGVERLMMASDFPVNLGMQRMLWDSLGISEEEKASGLGGLAMKVFGLEGKIAQQTWTS